MSLPREVCVGPPLVVDPKEAPTTVRRPRRSRIPSIVARRLVKASGAKEEMD